MTRARARTLLGWAVELSLVACLACGADDTTLLPTNAGTAAELPGLARVLSPVEPARGAPDDLVGDRVGGDRAISRAALTQPVRASTAPNPDSGCLAASLVRPTDARQRERIVVSGSTLSSVDSNQSQLGGCAGATSGHDRWYQLDLGAALRGVNVRAVLDADFDAAIELRRGPCADTLSLDCDRGRALGSASSRLAARLEPGIYWLVVDGKGPGDSGAFQLSVDIDPESGGCAGAPGNLSCEAPLSFRGAAVETLFVDTNCTTVEPGSDEKEQRYFALDLRAEPLPVLATLSAWSFVAPRLGRYLNSVEVYAAADSGSGCGAPIAASYLRDGRSSRTDAVLTTLLAPGRYVIVLRTEPLDADGQASPSALTLELDRQACPGGPVGNTCETALALDTRPGAYVVAGSTRCNQEHYRLDGCGEPLTPDQFYRLDLRAAAGPTRTRLSILVDGLGMQPLLYLLAEDGAGGCGEGLYCYDTIGAWEGPPHYDLTLAPALYFIGVESAAEGRTGSYRMLVELEPAQPSPCLTSAIDQCVFDNNLTFCCGAWDPACLDAAVLCGLAAQTRACICETEPSCCSAGADSARCTEVDSACGYLCPEFAPSETCLDRR